MVATCSTLSTHPTLSRRRNHNKGSNSSEERKEGERKERDKNREGGLFF